MSNFSQEKRIACFYEVSKYPDPPLNKPRKPRTYRVLMTHLSRTYHALNFAFNYIGIIYKVYNTGKMMNLQDLKRGKVRIISERNEQNRDLSCSRARGSKKNGDKGHLFAF